MENIKMKRTTNRAQFQKMVEIMKEHPDIAKNQTKSGVEVIQEVGQQLRDQLNSLGPPIKETTDWIKVWSDHKFSLRKKLAFNKQELKRTGGGKHTQVVFNPLEEDVIQLVCLKDGVEGLTNSQTFGVPRKRTRNDESPVAIPIINPEEIDESDAILEVEEQSETGKQAESSQSKGSKSFKLLERQINIQQKLSENIEKYIKTQNERIEEVNLIQKKIYRAIDRLSDRQKTTNEILQEEVNENKRHHERMEQLALEKNKMKEKILEIKLRKAELDLI